jgi:hypothetical protein
MKNQPKLAKYFLTKSRRPSGGHDFHRFPHSQKIFIFSRFFRQKPLQLHKSCAECRTTGLDARLAGDMPVGACLFFIINLWWRVVGWKPIVVDDPENW